MRRWSVLLSVFALALVCAGCGGVGGSVAPATTGVPAGWGELRVSRDLVPAGSYGRQRVRRLEPRYITIHSTQNFAAVADARAHARMLKTGALKASHNSLGYLTWHFTVDDHSIWQSLPCNEQGQHADYEGAGNRQSIGIEMCENRGNSRAATVERTAKLTALLLREYRIPLRNVVPHQHWRMIRYSDRRDLGHKNCPHFLLDHGRPGPRWQAFLALVERYRSQL
jgi:N-acetylmuramoyl-L-alanine amidase